MSEESSKPPAERVRELLGAVSEGLGLDAEIDLAETENGIEATFVGEDLGLLIGRHGQTIDAVQHLAYKVAVQDPREPTRVVVDAAGYRERRREVLGRQADEAADAALRSGQPVALDAMNASERKLVHEYLKAREEIETYSEGSEPNRHLVVAPRRST